MIVLACETSTLVGSVALLKDNRIVSSVESLRQGSHSDRLNLFIDQALSEANLKLSAVDLFATGVGPGSFTGIRISLNTIKTFSYCYKKPSIGIDSLFNLAFQFKTVETENIPIVTLLNAYKNMVYIATYKKEGSALKTVKEPTVIRIQNLDTYIETPSYVVGEGFLAYKNYLDSNASLQKKLIRPISPQDEPSAVNLAYLSLGSPQLTKNWDQLLPLYLRESEAEENAKGIKYQPLF